jgi:hypothetical protein
MVREHDEFNLIEILYRDHASIHDLFWRLRRSAEHDRGVLFDELTALMIRHEVAEEAVVFPFLASLPGGADLAGPRLEEQQRSEQDLITLSQLDPTHRGFADGVARLEAAFMAHVAREEAEVFPMIELNATITVVEHLGARYEASRHSSVYVPTRTVASGTENRASTITLMIQRIKRAVKAS